MAQCRNGANLDEDKCLKEADTPKEKEDEEEDAEDSASGAAALVLGISTVMVLNLLY